MGSGIKCINVHKELGGFEIKDVSFEMSGGYILGVIGRNGCGKTSLIRTLMGLYRMKKGESDIIADGISIMENIKAYKGNIGYVLSKNPFSDWVSPLLIGELYGDYYPAFDINNYLSLLFDFKVSASQSLSGYPKGDIIKVQLAFALSIDAGVYIFDEPTGSLDPEFRDKFYDILRELVSKGKTVIYATHLLEELDGLADYVLWMQRNENVSTVRYFGTADALKEQYRMVQYAGDENELAEILTGKAAVAGGRKRESHREYLIRLSDNILPEAVENCARYADLKEIMYYEEKGGMV